MGRQLWSSVRTTLRFYRRNRLLWLVAIVLGFSFAISLIPALFFQSSSQRFEIAKTVFDSLNYFFLLFAAVLGLVSVSSHVRDRSIKMVMTKPVAPAVWLGAHFVAAGLVLACLVVGNLLVSTGLFALWGIPWQSGPLFLGVTTLLRCLVLFSFLTFLSLVMHPVVAGITALILREGTFYQLSLLAASAERMASAGWYKGLIRGIEALLALVYRVLPIYDPYGDAVAAVATSFRVESSHLLPLLWTTAYTAAFAALLFVLTLAALRRKRLA